MVPRSCSSLKGPWERLRKHLFQFCQLESLRNESLQSWERGIRHRREGAQGGRCSVFYKTNRTHHAVPSKDVPLGGFTSTCTQLERRKQRAGPSPTTSACTAAYRSGKAAFNEKIQLGRKPKETQSMLSGKSFSPAPRPGQHTKAL